MTIRQADYLVMPMVVTACLSLIIEIVQSQVMEKAKPMEAGTAVRAVVAAPDLSAVPETRIFVVRGKININKEFKNE